MTVKDELRQLWTESFDDPQEWVEAWFERVYAEEDAMVLRRGGRVASALHLLRYGMTFHGTVQPLSYISGAATRRKYRGRGLMGRLLELSLRESYEREDTFCGLIPASDPLTRFYARKGGFAPVVYNRRERYTTAHPFDTEGVYYSVDDIYAPAVYDAFHRLEMAEPCRVIHTERQLLSIFDDIGLSDGGVAIMTDESGEICSMAFGQPRDGILEVRDVLASTPEAQTAALGHLHGLYPELPMQVNAAAPNADTPLRLTPAGMLRVVNVEGMLRALAEGNRGWRAVVSVTDPVIEPNNGTWRIEQGAVERGAWPPDLSVDIELLSRIVFSAGEWGEVMGIPSVRPRMTLMLE